MELETLLLISKNLNYLPIEDYEKLTENLNEISKLLQGLIKSIQNKITEYVNQAKANQKADDISVYFRRLDNGSWFAINPNATYTTVNPNIAHWRKQKRSKSSIITVIIDAALPCLRISEKSFL